MGTHAKIGPYRMYFRVPHRPPLPTLVACTQYRAASIVKGGGGEAHRKSPLTGGQAQPQGNVGLAGAAVSDGDDVLPAFDVFAAGQRYHLRPVHRGDGQEVDGIHALESGQAGLADPALPHALVAADEFQFREAVVVGWSTHSAAHWAARLRYCLSAGGCRGLMRQKEVAHLVYRLGFDVL